MKPLGIPTDITELQQYVREATKQRGFDDETIAQKFMLLSEEIGELARAARKTAGIKTADDTTKTELYDETADVLFVFINICNKLGINLAEAFEAKEAKNRHRKWQ